MWRIWDDVSNKMFQHKIHALHDLASATNEIRWRRWRLHEIWFSEKTMARDETMKETDSTLLSQPFADHHYPGASVFGGDWWDLAKFNFLIDCDRESSLVHKNRSVRHWCRHLIKRKIINKMDSRNRTHQNPNYSLSKLINFSLHSNWSAGGGLDGVRPSKLINDVLTVITAPKANRFMKCEVKRIKLCGVALLCSTRRPTTFSLTPDINKLGEMCSAQNQFRSHHNSACINNRFISRSLRNGQNLVANRDFPISIDGMGEMSMQISHEKLREQQLWWIQIDFFNFPRSAPVAHEMSDGRHEPCERKEKNGNEWIHFNFHSVFNMSTSTSCLRSGRHINGSLSEREYAERSKYKVKIIIADCVKWSRMVIYSAARKLCLFCVRFHMQKRICWCTMYVLAYSRTCSSIWVYSPNSKSRAIRVQALTSPTSTWQHWLQSTMCSMSMTSTFVVVVAFFFVERKINIYFVFRKQIE